MHLHNALDSGGHRWLPLIVSLRKSKERRLINPFGYEHSEIILELQGQDLNVCSLFEDVWAFISGLI